LEESLSLAIAENKEILLVGDLIKPANGKRFSSLIAAEERFARRNICDSATEIPY